MDNVTHAAIGMGVYATYAAVSHTPDGSALAAASCAATILGAELPDVDIAFDWFGGHVQYLYQHRQLSHSMPFWVLFSLFAGCLVNLFVPGHFWLYTMLAFAGMLSHIGSDLLTSYGTLAFWPFTKRRFLSDVLFVTEPFYTLIFLIGFSLVELRFPFDPVVYTLDIAACLYTLWRVILRLWLGARVKAWIRSNFAEDEIPSIQWRVAPTLLPIPHGTKYVVVQNQHFYFGSFTWKVKLNQESVKISDTSAAALFALRHSEVGKAMSWFSPLLFCVTEQDGQWTVVRMADATVRYVDSLSFSGIVDLLPTKHGDYQVAHEGLRAQAVDINKLWKQTFLPVQSQVTLHIPSPRGYRSKSRS